MKAFLLFQYYGTDEHYPAERISLVGIALAETVEEVAHMLRGELRKNDYGEWTVRIPKDRFTVKVTAFDYEDDEDDETCAGYFEGLVYRVGPLELFIVPEENYLDLTVRELPVLSIKK